MAIEAAGARGSFNIDSYRPSSADNPETPLRRGFYSGPTEMTPMAERRELYRSPNSDCWYLGRERENGHAFIIHQPNSR